MKQLLIALTSIWLTTAISCFAQTNTFPTSGNVGIGTTSPASPLHIRSSTNRTLRLDYTTSASTYTWQSWLYQGTENWRLVGRSGSQANLEFWNQSSDPILTLLQDGSVGIGTANPGGYMLNIQAGAERALIESTADAPLLVRGTNSWTGIGFDDAATSGSEYIWYRGASGTFSIGGGGANVSGKKLHVEGGTTIGTDYKTSSVPSGGLAVQGNVGIGTTDPSEKLEVNGTIRSKEVKVEATGWPDYVFAPGYSMPDLTALEVYINKHGHLPGVPMSDEVNTEGQNLGNLQVILLQKIEEMTLYLIEHQKLIQEQQEEITRLKAQQNVKN